MSFSSSAAKNNNDNMLSCYLKHLNDAKKTNINKTVLSTMLVNFSQLGPRDSTLLQKTIALRLISMHA